MSHHKKALMQIRKTMNKIDKNLQVVNDTYTELQHLFDDLEEDTDREDEE